MNQTRLLTDITDSTHLLKEDQCTNNQFIERILKLFDAPRGAPAFLTVVSAATKSVMRLLECLPSANHHADDVKYKFSDLGCCRFQRHFVKVVDETGGGVWKREGNSAASSSLRR